jgi:hypothetical protein
LFIIKYISNDTKEQPDEEMNGVKNVRRGRDLLVLLQAFHPMSTSR